MSTDIPCRVILSIFWLDWSCLQQPRTKISIICRTKKTVVCEPIFLTVLKFCSCEVSDVFICSTYLTNYTYNSKHMPSHSPDIKWAVFQAVSSGSSQAAVAREFGIPPSTVSGIVARYRKNRGPARKLGSGRPPKTTSRIDKIITWASRADPKKTALQILGEISTHLDVPISARTVQRRLVEHGLNGRRSAKKPLISRENRMCRLKWAKEHVGWSEDKWRKVLWSDESKFCLFQSGGTRWVRRPIGTRFDPIYQTPTVKHGGGSVMVWGCFSGSGLGPLVRIEATMDAHVYASILQSHMLPHARATLPKGWTFQQDNDPKHTSAFVHRWLKGHKVATMDWPSQSPDLNPIEHLWGVLEQRVAGTRARNAGQKFEQLRAAWNSIDQNVVTKLIRSMPRRCEAVIKAKGYATRY